MSPVNINNRLECRRVFGLLSESWYSSNLARLPYRDEVIISFIDEEGGTLGEFFIRWYKPEAGITGPRLEAHDDAWSALAYCGDVLHAMAALDDYQITPQSLCRLLLAMGLEDDTARSRPE